MIDWNNFEKQIKECPDCKENTTSWTLCEKHSDLRAKIRYSHKNLEDKEKLGRIKERSSELRSGGTNRKLVNNAKCKYCKKDMSIEYSIRISLGAHMRVSHPIIYKGNSAPLFSHFIWQEQEQDSQPSKPYFCPHCGTPEQDDITDGDTGYRELTCKNCRQDFRVYLHEEMEDW